MRTAIIGGGQVGQALGRRLARAGYDVVYGSRTPDPGRADQTGLAEAVAGAEAAILAVPWSAVEQVAAAADWSGRIVLDATNPLRLGPAGLELALGHDSSGAERVAALMPGAHVFKAFNQTGVENMAAPDAFALRPAMFIAGDHDPSRPAVLRLVGDAGFDAIDAGPLRNARLLEPLAMLWIDLALKRGFGRDFAFTVQRRTARV